jgi:hypothetical protein
MNEGDTASSNGEARVFERIDYLETACKKLSGPVENGPCLQ